MWEICHVQGIGTLLLGDLGATGDRYVMSGRYVAYSGRVRYLWEICLSGQGLLHLGDLSGTGDG